MLRRDTLWGAFALLLFLVAGIAAAAPGAGPAIEAWETDNGARVMFVAAPQLPMVDVRVVFDAGSARDGGLPGLARITNSMLSEGADDLDVEQIGERFAGLGAQFGTSSHRDMAIVSLRSLTDRALLEPALDTLATVLAEPTFPTASLERVRNRTLVGLRAIEQSPGRLAEQAFYETLYRAHPYATLPQGRADSLRGLAREDLQGFYRRHYVARNAVVAIVGDLTREQAAALAATVVGRLPSGAAAPPIPAVGTLDQAERVALAHPSTQTHILVGQPGMSRDDPDYFALYVGNHVLGGSGFGSRVVREIRETRGLAYSAYSYFGPMRAAGPFIMGLQTRTEQAHTALEVLKDTLRRFVEDGPTEAELSASKKNITGGFPLLIDSNAKIVDYIAMIGFYGLPLDYLETFNARVEAVTADQIREAFQRRVNPERLVTVLVGTGAE